MIIKARFKIYNNIICDENRDLYQLEHFKNKRVYPFKKLVYNKDRKAYRINSQWVSKKRLYNLIILQDKVVRLYEEESVLERLLNEIKKAI